MPRRQHWIGGIAGMILGRRVEIGAFGGDDSFLLVFGSVCG